MGLTLFSTILGAKSISEEALLTAHSADGRFILPSSRARSAQAKIEYWQEKNTLPELNTQLGRHPLYPYDSILDAEELTILHGDIDEIFDGHLLLLAFLCEYRPPYRIIIEYTQTGKFFEESQRDLLRQYLSLASEVCCYSARNLRDLERSVATSIPNSRVLSIPKVSEKASPVPGRIFCPLPLDVVKNGQDLLLRSLAEFKDRPWSLLLSEDGKDKEYIDELASYLGIYQRLSFVPARAIEHTILSSSLVALPSRFDAGLYELSLAIGSGVPVIATDLGARSELISQTATATLPTTLPATLLPGANTALLTGALGLMMNTVLPKYRPSYNAPGDQKPPKLSVIVPCYNYGRFLRQSVGSILAQTFQDLEIIVVNDGSTDDSAVVADALARDYGIRVIHQANSGQPAIARNRGFEASRGEYVISLDADDLFGPDMLGRLVAALDDNPSVDVAYGEGIFFNDQGKVWRETTGEFSLEKLKDVNQLFYCGMYRRRVFESCGGYNLNVRGYEDWDFWIGAAKLGFRGIKVPEALLYYRVASTGLFHNALERDKELRANIKKNHPRVFRDASDPLSSNR